MPDEMPDKMQDDATQQPKTMTPQATQQVEQGTDGRDGRDIIDTTTSGFMADVIEASKEKLVIVDFWAPWCEPCKQLGPLLESVVTQSAGQVRLAKMNIEEHPQIAKQLQVKSIPAVFAFKDGQPVDGFMGALPESEVKKFIEKHLGTELGPSEIEKMLAAGQHALEQGEHANAIELFNGALDLDGKNIDAIAGLAQCYIAIDAPEAADEVLQMAPVSATNNPALATARAALELKNKASDVDEAETPRLREAVAADENNHQARFDLALALHACGNPEAAVDELLEIVSRNRQWNEEAARKQLIELFDAYGATNEVTVSGRRRLSSLLFT